MTIVHMIPVIIAISVLSLLVGVLLWKVHYLRRMVNATVGLIETEHKGNQLVFDCLNRILENQSTLSGLLLERIKHLEDNPEIAP